MNSSELITLVRQVGAIPDTGASGSEDPDVLLLADNALTGHLLPRLLNLTEDYFVLRQRDPVSASTVVYRLPLKAAYDKLRDVFFVDNDAGRHTLDLIPAEELPDYDLPSGGGIPDGFIPEGNYIRLVPDTGSYSGFLEFAFFQRPGALVTLTNARRITSFDPVTRQITLDSITPTDWVVGSQIDIHSQHSGAELKLWNAQVQSGLGTAVLTLTTAFPIDGSLFGSKPVAIGDWVVLTGKAAVPPIPEELHGLLARATCLVFAESAGYADKATIHAQILDKFFTVTEKAMEGRVEGRPIRLGRQGFLNRNRGYWPSRTST